MISEYVQSSAKNVLNVHKTYPYNRNKSKRALKNSNKRVVLIVIQRIIYNFARETRVKGMTPRENYQDYT